MNMTLPSAAPATISPSPATATALSGAGSVMMVGALPSSGQMRTCGSWLTLTTDLPSAANATPLTFC